MGKVIMSGIVPLLTKPSTGILASDIAVGSIVKLMESGNAVEYRVVHQGLPSSLYDASCNGCWLLRKDIYCSYYWDTSKLSTYEASTIHYELSQTFLPKLGSIETETIKQIKIPYFGGGGKSGTLQSGADGLSCKAFPLSGYEVGWTTSDNQYFPADGAKLDYFASGKDSSANLKRIANYNGDAALWWLRSPWIGDDISVWCVQTMGAFSAPYADESHGYRPALILPSNALFDTDTMILKGVA